MKLSDIDLAEVIALYEDNRFLDAYEAVKPLWRQEYIKEDLPVEHLVHAARLSGRLGGNRVRRWLCLKAIERYPENPLTRIYCQESLSKRKSVYKNLVNFEKNPELGTDDPKLNAVWNASNAIWWGFVRNFDKAHSLIDKAFYFQSESDWTYCCQAWLYFYQDQWADALEASEKAWEMRPLMPSLTNIMARTLVRLGKLDEAINRIVKPASSGQSYENLMQAILLIVMKAERSDGSKRQECVKIISHLTSKLESLSPLYDRESKEQISKCSFPGSFLATDYKKILSFARQIKSPFYKYITEKLEGNTEGNQYILKYKPVIQKHNTCLPSSIAAVMGNFGIDLDEDKIADSLTYFGTTDWRATNWLKKEGYHTKSFIATPELCRALVKAGLPFVFTIKSPGSSHAIAVIGYDSVLDILILHDPSSENWSMVPVEKILESEAPYGPECLAIVTPAKKELLDIIPESQCVPATFSVKYFQTWEEKGQDSCHSLIEQMKTELPEHPCTQRLAAMQAASTGDIGVAINQQEKLLEQYPKSFAVRSDLLQTLRQTNDTFRICQVMGDIVDKGKLPAVSEKQKWRFPPAIYVGQYADYISHTARGLHKAINLLKKSLGFEPTCAHSYHLLGDMYCYKGHHSKSLMPFLIAAGLEDTNDHFARTLANAYRFAKRESEGLEYLKKRLNRLGRLVEGWRAWIAYIEALEEYGYPDQAIEAMTKAQNERSQDGNLHLFATSFWCRMGFQEKAMESLKKTKSSDDKKLYLRAGVYLYNHLGDWEKAFQLCDQLIDTDKNDVGICNTYLELYTQKNGRPAMLKLIEKWTREHSGNERFEELYYDKLIDSFGDDEAEKLIKKRLKRNPYDSWAWGKLCTSFLKKADMSAADERKEYNNKAKQALDQMLKLTPHEAVTYAYKANVEDAFGNYSEAVRNLFLTLDIDPNNPYCFENIWNYFDRLSLEDQKALPSRLEDYLFRSHGYQNNARILAFKIASHFGLKAAEKRVDRWLCRIENDPALIEAKVDLILNYGQGRTDASRAIQLLKPAIEKFPNHFSLRISLAHSYDILGLDDKQVPVLKKLLKHEPKHPQARKKLAEIYARNNQPDEAVETLLVGTKYSPRESYVWTDSAALLWDIKRYEESLEILLQGLNKVPKSIELRENSINYAIELGQDDLAVKIAREGTEIYPEGAYIWYLLGYALERSNVTNDILEIERCYRKSLKYNADLDIAIDRLAGLLVSQNQFDQARQVVKTALAVTKQPAPHLALMANITRQEGNKSKSIDEMEDVIVKWPRYKWAWGEMMEWMEQDKDWERAKKVLKEPHPVILEDSQLCAHRLHLLEEAGEPSEGINKQWDRLLKDFPGEEVIHNRRFDMLIENNDLGKASEVIDSITVYRPNSPFVLARKVELLCKRKEWEEAIEITMRLWQLPGEDQIWPEQMTWKALRPVWEDTIDALLEVLEEGGVVRNTVFELIAHDIVAVTYRGTFWDRIHYRNTFSRPYPKIKMLLLMLKLLDFSKGDTAVGKAAVMDALASVGAVDSVISYWKRNKAKCHEQTPVWQKIGYILSNYSERLRRLRNWMRDWREHPGVEMFAISGYTYSLSRSMPLFGIREDIDELYRTSRDVLLHLRHDHTARFHAIVLCEACLRLGKYEDFLNWAEKYQYLLLEKDSNNWLPVKFVSLPKSYQLFVELLKEDNSVENAMWLTRELSSLNRSARPGWVKKVWIECIKDRLDLTKRLLCWIMLRKI